MILLSGAELVLPDRMLAPGTLVIEGGRITEIRPGAVPLRAGLCLSRPLRRAGLCRRARPRRGWRGQPGRGKSRCRPGGPTPEVRGDGFLPDDGGVRAWRAAARPGAGASGAWSTGAALRARAARAPREQLHQPRLSRRPTHGVPEKCESGMGRSGRAGRRRMRSSRPSKRPMCFSRLSALRPTWGSSRSRQRLDGGIELIRWLTSRGHLVSLGHSAATYEEAIAAIVAGARQATHLFNRMAPLDHRAPGLCGAVLQTEEVAAEIICDGFHVHPALVRTAAAAKRPSRMHGDYRRHGRVGPPSRQPRDTGRPDHHRKRHGGLSRPTAQSPAAC